MTEAEAAGIPVRMSREERASPLGPLWGTAFLASLPFAVLAFALPIYGKMLGASALQVGALFSAVSFAPVLVRPFLGRMVDRWGRRPFILAGLASYAVSMALTAMAGSVALLAVARVVQGLGQAFFWLSAYTIVADVAHEWDRARGFGAIDEASSRGSLVGALPGVALIAVTQATGLPWAAVWPWLFGVYTLGAGAGLALGAWRIGETGPSRGGSSRLPSHESDPSYHAPRRLSLQLIALMGIVFITGASTAMVWPVLVVFLEDRLKAGAFELAVAYLPAALVSSFLPSRIGRLTDRMARKPLMVAGLVTAGVASAVMPRLRAVWPLAILWAVDSLGYAASSPAERAFVADIAGRDRRGRSYGLYTFAYFLGAAVGPLAGGWLYDTMGQSYPFYGNSIVLGLAAALLIALLREPARSRAVRRPPGGRGSVPPAHRRADGPGMR